MKRGSYDDCDQFYASSYYRDLLYIFSIVGWVGCPLHEGLVELPFEDLSGSLGVWEALVFLVLYSLLAMGPSLTNASPTKLPLRIDQG